ncbi:hypothetical protein KVT40_002062 [Elsinoe batatas]|uniref:Uncharacterized protein n=1 Tax=Elsinoe batatas TaxID=2601811 RepID=A0A8K0LDX8_9PEZI|nr:hypothetical protein KVT40_002062 [Elsinoe batatas]
MTSAHLGHFTHLTKTSRACHYQVFSISISHVTLRGAFGGIHGGTYGMGDPLANGAANGHANANGGANGSGHQSSLINLDSDVRSMGTEVEYREFESKSLPFRSAAAYQNTDPFKTPEKSPIPPMITSGGPVAAKAGVVDSPLPSESTKYMDEVNSVLSTQRGRITEDGVDAEGRRQLDLANKLEDLIDFSRPPADLAEADARRALKKLYKNMDTLLEERWAERLGPKRASPPPPPPSPRFQLPERVLPPPVWLPLPPRTSCIPLGQPVPIRVQDIDGSQWRPLPRDPAANANILVNIFGPYADRIEPTPGLPIMFNYLPTSNPFRSSSIYDPSVPYKRDDIFTVDNMTEPAPTARPDIFERYRNSSAMVWKCRIRGTSRHHRQRSPASCSVSGSSGRRNLLAVSNNNDASMAD